MISSCGKCGASSAGVSGGCAATASVLVSTVSVARFNAPRQRGHKPSGALGGSGAAQRGHLASDGLLIAC